MHRLPHLAAVAWPLLLVGALAALVAPQDVNLTDGGFILATSHRILSGELPHADFITARPGGSAFVHVFDLMLPGPTWFGSRTVALAQLVTYSVLLTMLVLDRPFRRLGLVGVLAATAAALVNLHTFPAMAWHTIDGMFFGAAGFVVLERGLKTSRTPTLVAAGLLLGAAPLMKQSFGAVPLLGLARVLWQARPLLRPFVTTAAATATPGLLYVGAVALAGGYSFMVDELTGNGHVVYGKEILDHLDEMWWPMAAVAVLAALGYVRWLAPVPQVVLTLIVLHTMLAGDLAFTTPWSFRLFWLAATVFTVACLARRELDWPGLLVLAFAWMVTLSWGAARPAFLGGSLALYVLARTWEGTSLPLSRLAAAAAAAFVAVNFWSIRHDRVTLPDRPASTLSVRMGGIAPALRGIRTDPTTAEYMKLERRCIKDHPARWVAVLPEDSMAAVTFDFHNPFPMDWLWPDEYQSPGARERIVAAAQRIGREGRYLVLVQKPRVTDLYAVPSKPLLVAGPGETPQLFPFDPGLVHEIFAHLKGRPITCGPFSGVYEPRDLTS